MIKILDFSLEAFKPIISTYSIVDLEIKVLSFGVTEFRHQRLHDILL